MMGVSFFVLADGKQKTLAFDSKNIIKYNK